MERDFVVTLSTGERVGMRLADAAESLRVLTLPGQANFEMVAAPHETDEEIVAEARWFIENVDRLNPEQFARERRDAER